MRVSRRISLVVLLLALAFPVLLFPSFIQDNIVTPVALMLWLFWRIVQSVDQAAYWVLLILLIVGYFFARVLRWIPEASAVESPSIISSNAMLERINYWRHSIRLGSEAPETGTPEHDLGKLLATLYAAKQPEAVQFEIYDDLKSRKIPLPEPIHAFLFPPEPDWSRRSLKQILARIRDIAQRRVRRWTGRETAEYYDSLDQVIEFMESSLEYQYVDGHLDPDHR